ncbi:hypothetical protein Goari_002879 [Gossypium aridum]|uniref:Beta-galactosidase n=1 Tax=Gossypium aridum TaxID=34290 RepID=A0A7J8Y9R4_GOSAI|nr:hypothetical protein [Gossypium aridum]
MTKNEVSSISESWMSVEEPIGIWSESNFTVQGLLEHLKVTKDESDYLWHMTRIYVSDDDVAFWEENKVSPTLVIDSMRDVLRIFINGELIGSVSGHWVKVLQPVQFQQGYSDLMLLSQTVGLQDATKAYFKSGVQIDVVVNLQLLIWVDDRNASLPDSGICGIETLASGFFALEIQNTRTKSEVLFLASHLSLSLHPNKSITLLGASFSRKGSSTFGVTECEMNLMLSPQEASSLLSKERYVVD